MQLGSLSISLAVKNINVSQEFYGKLGFVEVGGDREQHWLILRNENHTIGLFCGMFDKNMITFNPGWNELGEETLKFTDVRDIQRNLKQQGVELESETDEATQGPASILLKDPDGNPILIDQHR